MSLLRIISKGILGHQTEIVYVAADGTETDISDIVQSMRIIVKAGELNRVVLNTIKVEAFVLAESEE